MEIILNPTNKCDFNCEFCSASNLPNKTMTAKETIKIFNKYKGEITGVILNGGDPLNMDIDWYYKILDYLDKNYTKSVFLSLTSNLSRFYKEPYKLEPILKHPRVGVITSFQYGNARKDQYSRVYGEEQFRKTVKLFNYIIGYSPDFISVIDEDNERFVLNTVKLAKSLNVHCKLNKAICCGRQSTYYPRYRMYKNYIKIIDSGLMEYEDNCKLLRSYFKGEPTYCPISNKCYKSIHTFNADGKEYTCSYNANEGQEQPRIPYIKQECLGCENFKLCCSCNRMVREVLDHQDGENYCKEMKSIIPELKERMK